MGDKSSIEWTDATWNPVRGCSRISPGCGGPNHQGGCYAEGIAARFSGPGQPFEGFAERTPHGGRWTGKMDVVWPMVDQPIRWRKPRRIFANSMSDLFHKDLPREDVAMIYGTAIAAVHLRGHTFQILTKRADHMRELLNDEEFWEIANAEAGRLVIEHTDPLNRRNDDARATCGEYGPDAPPPGIWLGVSTEDQLRADERIPHLLATPAAVRFLSCEPLLGAIRLDHMQAPEGFFIDALKGEHWHPGAGSISSQTFSGKPPHRLDHCRRRERPEGPPLASRLVQRVARPVRRGRGAVLLQAVGRVAGWREPVTSSGIVRTMARRRSWQTQHVPRRPGPGVAAFWDRGPARGLHASSRQEGRWRHA